MESFPAAGRGRPSGLGQSGHGGPHKQDAPNVRLHKCVRGAGLHVHSSSGTRALACKRSLLPGGWTFGVLKGCIGFYTHTQK